MADDFPDRLGQLLDKGNVHAFAKKIGMSDPVVRQYLSGKSQPSRTAIIQIIKATGVTADWLLTGEGPMRRGETTTERTEGRVEAATASFDSLGMAEGMGLLAKIYASADNVFIRAINANLMAFGEALDNKAIAQNTARLIEEMNRRMDQLEKQMATLRQENSDLKAKIRDSPDKVANG